MLHILLTPALMLTWLLSITKSSEFDYNYLDEADSDYNFNTDANSVEFQPTSTTTRPLVSYGPVERRNPSIYRYIRYKARSDQSIITFPSSSSSSSSSRPTVASIKIYSCDGFLMKCEYRPNYDTEYPLHCQMVQNKV